ncbi:hypothetical protein CcI156_05905 [Frankia sp. CcI156]|nr:hypothetical protein CcI6DRAFT_02877 [Frankia sp. CcI6]KFB03861.1 hypothetical protein ALLO2DRAFT_03377 [Frankia sp. Allo2]OAA29089.1 hypothetical protein AAY23_101722 [Frankia casuarinae]OHV48519.1 hypothetical protein CgIS1_05780 [Frankia sp. CgIS1]ONH28243.1 hypothetical protein CcI156_05905 [Frankia sp. CcI156]
MQTILAFIGLMFLVAVLLGAVCLAAWCFGAVGSLPPGEPDGNDADGSGEAPRTVTEETR